MNGVSRIERLAALLRSKPGQWCDGRQLATVAGCYGWRSRVSDLRRPPFNMRIENRLRKVGVHAARFTISEYRFVPAPLTSQLCEISGSLDPKDRKTAEPMLPLECS